MEKKYILNRETGKIELHFEKSEYQEMPEDKKRILRSNYLFSRKAEVWVSRAKYPNLYSAKRAAEQLAAAGVAHRLVQGAPREAERRGADRRAEDVERRHRDLEAVAGPADAVFERHAAALEAQGRQWMRRNHLDTFGDGQAGRTGLDQEGGEPARAGCLAGANEDDVMVGNAAIRNPGFFTVQHIVIAVAHRRHFHIGDVRTRSWFR